MGFENHAKNVLLKGGIAVGLGLRQARTVDVAMIGKRCGFDWLFIDMEHNTMTVDMAVDISVSALSCGITPIVRVPGIEGFHASRVLDGGAMGVIVPHIDTAEDAARVVSQCRYPPHGQRSIGGLAPQLGFEAMPTPDMTKKLNDGMLVVVMLETERAIDNAEAIAAVEGVDVLLIGTNDLSADMGIMGQFTHPRIEDAYRRVVAACAKHGKHPGMGGIYQHDIMEKYIGIGARFLLGGSDLSFMMKAASERTAFLRSVHHVE